MEEHNVKFSNKGIKGLQNLGNTCYINAALQALAHIKPLRLYFTKTYFRRLRLQYDNSIDALFCQFISTLWPSGRIQENNVDLFIVLRALVSFIWKRYSFFSPGDQHDSQEFLQCLLSDLHEALKIPYYSDIDSLFVYLEKSDLPLKHLANALLEFDPENGDLNEYDKNIEEFINKTIGMSEQTTKNDLECESNCLSCIENDPNISEYIPLFLPDKKEILKYKSIISDLFVGELENTILCTSCGKTSIRCETFLSLSIPITAIDRAIKSKIQCSIAFPLRLSVPFNTSQHQQTFASSSYIGRSLNYAYEAFQYYYESFWNWFDWFMSFVNNPSVDLNDCLETFFNPELLENENRYHCDNCKKLCNGIKCIRIKKLPEILIVHLNRYQNINSVVRKITSQLNFPLVDFSLNSFLVDDSSIIMENTLYDLIAVICHNGTQVTNGHYICYALDEHLSEWFEFDDIHVYHVDKDRILSTASNAYILFYQRNNKQSISSRALEVVCNLEKKWIQTWNDPKYTTRFNMNKIDYYFFSLNRYPVIPNDVYINSQSIILSKYWVNSFLSLQNPGPIQNLDIFCSHSLIRPTEFLFFNNLSLPVIEPVGRFLWYIYGGGPLFNKKYDLCICPICNKILDVFDQRRRYEYINFHSLQSQQTKMFHKLKLKTSTITINFENLEKYQDANSDDVDRKDDKDHEDNEENVEEKAVSLNPNKTIETMKALNLNDSNTRYYLISAEWMIKWLSFVNVRFDRSVVGPRDRQLMALLEQINKKRMNNFNEDLFDDVYQKRIDLKTDFIHPPLASLQQSILNTINKHQCHINPDEVLKQINPILHTVEPPESIDNWSLFGIKQKILTENRNRMSAKKKGNENDDESLLTIEDANDYNELCSIICQMLSNCKLDQENKICQYKFTFHSRLGGAHEENNLCVFYLMSQEYWDLFKQCYSGGPTITFDYLLNKFEATFSSEDIEYFMRMHFRREMTNGSLFNVITKNIEQSKETKNDGDDNDGIVELSE